MRPASISQGFTLVELVIAITLTGMFMGIVLSTLYTGVKTQRAVGQTVLENEDLRTATRFLRRQLQHIDSNDRFAEKTNTPVFVGRPNGVQFTARPVRADRLGILTFELDARPARSGAAIALNMKQPAESGPGGDSWNTTLISGLQRVSFSYFGKPERGDVPHWTGHWDFPNLPSLMRISYRTSTGTANVIDLPLGHPSPRRGHRDE